MPNVVFKDVQNAIYIDFEGNVDREPTFLGALYSDSGDKRTIFTQYVHETLFHSAGAAKRQCVNQSIDQTFRLLKAVAMEENRIFLAWSTREKQAIESYVSDNDLRNFIKSRLFDSKKLARKWKNRFRRNVVFKRIPGQGRHRLSEYMKLVAYHVPNTAGPGNTGQRLRSVRNQLIRRNGIYQDLTPVTKAKWTKVLSHNYHDCIGMREITLTAIQDLKTFELNN